MMTSTRTWRHHRQSKPAFAVLQEPMIRQHVWASVRRSIIVFDGFRFNSGRAQAMQKFIASFEPGAHDGKSAVRREDKIDGFRGRNAAGRKGNESIAQVSPHTTCFLLAPLRHAAREPKKQFFYSRTNIVRHERQEDRDPRDKRRGSKDRSLSRDSGKSVGGNALGRLPPFASQFG